MCALESKEISSIRNLFGFSDYRHRSVDFWRRVPSVEGAAVRKKPVTTLSRLMSLQQRSAIARRGNNGRLRWQSNLRYGHIDGEGSDRLSRCGAAVKNLSHSASFHLMEKIAPSKSGIKHLVAL